MIRPFLLAFTTRGPGLLVCQLKGLSPVGTRATLRGMLPAAGPPLSSHLSLGPQGGADPGRGRNCQSQSAGHGEEFHLLPQQHPTQATTGTPMPDHQQALADGTSQALGEFSRSGVWRVICCDLESVLPLGEGGHSRGLACGPQQSHTALRSSVSPCVDRRFQAELCPHEHQEACWLHTHAVRP